MDVLKKNCEIITKGIGIAYIVIAIIMAGFGLYKAGEYHGIDKGRREMHNELCDDMRAENEAPLLLTNKYGRMYTYSYDDTYDEYQTKRSRK